MKRFAEDANYWTTTVMPGTSQGEISDLLEQFGATAVIIITGQVQGRIAWVIRFQWEGRSYRFLFTPLTCRKPEISYSFSGKRRTVLEQSKYQMGKVAVNFVKAVLTAAETTPAALFGFLELPAVTQSGMPATAAELDVDGLTAALPEINIKLLGEGE